MPPHHLPQDTEPYLVECRHLLWHPWVTILVNGVEGQATECCAGQYRPETHQVDVEGPAPAHTETSCQSSKSHKTPSGPSQCQHWGDLRVVGCPLERESQYSSQHFIPYEMTFLNIWISHLVLVVRSECPPPDKVCSGDDGSYMAIPTFHHTYVLHCRQLARRHSSPLATPHDKDKAWTD